MNMDASTIIAVGALCVSVYFGWKGVRRGEVADIRTRLEACEKFREGLEDRNLLLMQRLLKLENGG